MFEEISEKIAAIGVMPVITIREPEKRALPLASALIAGGIPVAEITFRTEGADRAIKMIKEKYPDMLVGAGTIINEELADRAIAAGASFIISPGFDPDLVKYCIDKGVPVYPGCTSASEYQIATKLGLRYVKFFPAEQEGGIPKMKILSGPFPQMKVMPTGGINFKTLKDYLSCKAVFACGGSFMAVADLIEDCKWDEITELCRQTVEIVKEVRG